MEPSRGDVTRKRGGARRQISPMEQGSLGVVGADQYKLAVDPVGRGVSNLAPVCLVGASLVDVCRGPGAPLASEVVRRAGSPEGQG